MENSYSEDLKAALDCLRRGGVILYPTDTVWGLGCDATNEDAVKKIYELKKRSDAKAMLVLTDGEAMIDRYVSDPPEVAWQLLETAEEPLTIIFDHVHDVASNLPAPDGSLGFRITKEKFSSELCKRLRKPIVSTSANLSGEKTAGDFNSIPLEIINGVDYIVKYGRETGKDKRPSHIIKLSDGGVIKIIR